MMKEEDDRRLDLFLRRHPSFQNLVATKDTGNNSNSNNNSRSNIDLKNETNQIEKLQSQVQDLLTIIGNGLNQADMFVNDELKEDKVASAILRGSKDVASMLGTTANQLEDFLIAQKQQLLEQQLQHDDNDDDMSTSLLVLEDNHNDEYIQAITMQDFHAVLFAVIGLLRDTQAELEQLDAQDAEDLADVSLTAARLAIASLQSMHATITPDDVIAALQVPQKYHQQQQSTVEIEIIEDDDDDNDNNGKKESDNNKSTESSNRSMPSSPQQQPSTSSIQSKRMRVLWPPLGPAMDDYWTIAKEQYIQPHPILTATVGLCCWPIVLSTAATTSAIYHIDGWLQDRYNEGSPVVDMLEQTWTNTYHSGRFGLVTAKIITKQTSKIVQRQVQRHGGVQGIAQQGLDLAIHKATHPIETIGQTWNGFFWTVGKVLDFVQNRPDVAQDLH